MLYQIDEVRTYTGCLFPDNHFRVGLLFVARQTNNATQLVDFNRCKYIEYVAAVKQRINLIYLLQVRNKVLHLKK